MRQSLRIGFVHPQLGVGGAERLVLDAASCLQQAGHRVTIFTSRHNRDHSLDDARHGAVEVRTYGDFLPLDIADRMLAPFNVGRTCYAAFRLAMSREHFDVIFTDLVSQSIPILRLMTRAKIIFYCHFPDRLLAPQRGGLYRWYRIPIDWSERVAIGMAHLVIANSRFTASIIGRTFPRLGPPQLLYPGVDVASFASNGRIAHDDSIMLLAINRYDRRKNTGLAIEALAGLEARLPTEIFRRVQLVIAGGFDDRSRQNHEVLRELQVLANRPALTGKVVFLRSPDDRQIQELLSRCRCVVYTSEYEHFGYVPLEAMAAARPVISVNTGGPAETIVDGTTGLLCSARPAAFADALAGLVADPDGGDRLGRAGRAHVAAKFSKAVFGAQLEQIVEEAVGNSRNSGLE
ncbi:MAG: glycosyltransferase [Candidatus Binatus sp.]